MEILIGFFIGVIIASIAANIIITPKLHKIEKLNTETLEKNQNLENQYQIYLKQNQDAQNKLKEIKNNIDNGKIQLELTLSEYNTISDNLQKQKDIAETAANDYRNAEFQKIDFQIKEKEKEFDIAKADYENEYLTILSEYSEAFSNKNSKLLEETDELICKLNDLRSRVDAAVEAAKRREEEQNVIDFYKLQLSKEDLEEVQKLKSIAPYLRNAEPLNKVIWKTYYEKPTTDMLGRVVGQKIISGIYKITNLENEMCYVGQAVDIASRWKQHIKRGLGAETPTRNKLYPAMASFGVENFSFEIIEQCAKDKLDEQEDYWQDFYHAKDFGYSII